LSLPENQQTKAMLVLAPGWKQTTTLTSIFATVMIGKVLIPSFLKLNSTPPAFFLIAANPNFFIHSKKRMALLVVCSTVGLKLCNPLLSWQSFAAESNINRLTDKLCQSQRQNCFTGQAVIRALACA